MAGPWDKYSAGSGVTVTPTNPNAALDAENTRGIISDRGADNARADAASLRDAERLELDRQNQKAALAQKGLRFNEAGELEQIPGWTPPPTAEQAQQQRARAGQLRALREQLARVRELYSEGPGTTKGLAGLGDYLPTDANGRFNAAAAGLGEIALGAFRVPGVGSQSDAELRAFIEANRPSAGDRDTVIEEKLRNIENRLNSTLQESGINLDDRRDQQGGIGGVVGSGSSGGGDGGGTPNWSWAGSPRVNGPVGDAAPAGSTTRNEAIPPQVQSAVDAYLASVPRGQLDQQAFAGFLNSLYEANGLGRIEPGEYDAFVKGYNTKGVGVDTRVRGREVPMSAMEQLRNSAVNNPVGGAVAGYLDTAGFGIPTALAGEQTDALARSQGLPYALGQIGGALTATSGLGAIGRNTVGRVAPRTLRGGSMGMFGRNLATDAAFGGIYGGTTEGDPLGGAGAAALGSVLGQAGGRALAGVAGGGGSAAARYLRGRNIPLTAGQALGGTGRIGNMVRGVEDQLAGMPVVGDMINARRLEGLRAYNENAFGDVAGQQITGTGPDAVEQLRPIVGNMYDRATAGVTVPVSGQLTSDLAQARALGSSLPPDLADRFERAMANRVDPVISTGQVSGTDYQQMRRALNNYRAEAPRAGFEQDYRDALGAVGSALDDNMRAGGGASVLRGLDEANDSYRRLKVLEDAVVRARNGSRSGEADLFTPSQLNDASVANARKFGGGQATTDRPFYDLGAAGQSVLPSRIPDSGTAGRLSTLALPGILGGGGAGLDYATGTDDLGKSGLALGALLTLGGTRTGQRALTAAIMDRPDSLRTLGQWLGRRQGMLGAAAAPLLIEQLGP